MVIVWSLSLLDWRDMSLAEQLKGSPPTRPSSMCRVQAIYDLLGEEDRDALMSAFQKVASVPSNERMNGSPYTAMWIIRILKANGHTLGRDAAHRHIRLECGCESL
jgi:hypothetical protein